MSCETMTRNPCRLCAHHLSGGDKSAACCMECKDRVAYVRAIGGMYGGMPDHMTDLCRPRAGVNKEDIVENMENIETKPRDEVKVRVCNKCGQTKPLDEFCINRTCKHDREPVCKDCKNEAERQKTAAARAERLKRNPPKPEKPQDLIWTRACRVCQATKPLAEFVSNKTCKDGRESICKDCLRIRNREARWAKKVKPAEQAPEQKAWVEPIEPAEIGIPIEEETPAQPEPATSPVNVRIVNALDARFTETIINPNCGGQALFDAFRTPAPAPRMVPINFHHHHPSEPPANSDAQPDPTLRSQVSSLSPLDVQVGGDHYKHFAIQPIEFSTRNRLGFIEGCIVKRICRYNKPGGKGLQDLLKIKHEIDCLIAIDAKEKMEATS